VTGGKSTLVSLLIVGVCQQIFEGFNFIDAGGNGRESLVSRNQINIRADLIGVCIVEQSRYPKAGHKEFPATTVVSNAITVPQINQKPWYNVGLL